MATDGNKLGANTVINEEVYFGCELCHYKCSKKFNLDRHFLTDKHIKATFINKSATKNEKKEKKLDKLSCEKCGKEYNDRTGLWRHKKGCNLHNNIETIDENKKLNEIDKDELIINLLKQNAKLMEILENGTMNNSHNNHTNSHNKAFNLNFFLNETCKNAMNITDFVESIKLQLSDLMEVGEIGYVEGISKIIVKNLNNLDETIRPIHCTDKKRETMYIKDEDKWEKDEDKIKLKKAVKSIANKNIRLLPKFREKYPEYNQSTSKISDTYDKIVIETMLSDQDKDEKIIKKISKATTIKEP
jgi:hypothetical protein